MNCAKLNLREGSAARRGMTLIELLVVMGLIALVLGAGIGALAGIDVGTGPAVALVNSSLRSANNWAVARRAPARVSFDAETNTIHAEGLDVIGTWHFENIPPRGAFGLNGDLDEVDLAPDGYIGKALDLESAVTGGGYVVPVHTSPTYDLSSGFQIAFAAMPTGSGSGRVVSIGESVVVEFTEKGKVKAHFMGEKRDENGQVTPAGKGETETSEGLLRVGSWSRILVSYDRRELAIFVEGVPVADTPEDAWVVKVNGPLIVGGKRCQWEGRIDSLVISAVAAEEEVELPEGVSFSETAPKQVAFQAGGGLDRRVHSGPVRFSLEFSDSSNEVIEVGVYGTVR